MTTTSRRKTVDVATSTTRMVNNNPDRRQITFVNNGTTTVHLDNDESVSTSSGLILLAGGTISLNLLEDGNLVQEIWIGISTTTANNVRVFEVLNVGKDE